MILLSKQQMKNYGCFDPSNITVSAKETVLSLLKVNFFND